MRDETARPHHPISIAPAGKRVRVTFAGRVVADSTHALALSEARYSPVLYIPRADADMGALQRSEKHSHCPCKARYFSIVVDGRDTANAVWSYEQPFPAVAAIAGHLSFYPNRVDAIEESPL